MANLSKIINIFHSTSHPLPPIIIANKLRQHVGVETNPTQKTCSSSWTRLGTISVVTSVTWVRGGDPKKSHWTWRGSLECLEVARLAGYIKICNLYLITFLAWWFWKRGLLKGVIGRLITFDRFRSFTFLRFKIVVLCEKGQHNFFFLGLLLLGNSNQLFFSATDDGWKEWSRGKGDLLVESKVRMLHNIKCQVQIKLFLVSYKCALLLILVRVHLPKEFSWEPS